MHCEKIYQGNGKAMQEEVGSGAELRRGSFHHDEAKGKDDKEVPCLVASIFLNKFGGNHLLRGREDGEGFQVNSKILKQLLSGRNERGEKRERDGAPRTKLTL